MIPNITWGDNPVGLTSYLVAEGRSNEHESPHLVAGSAPIMAWHSDHELTHEDAVLIGQEIQQPYRVFGGKIPNGHVRHISLSLPQDDGKLGDGRWGIVATDFMRKMGYIDQDGKADVRWAAFHHGPSGRNGNDHVHLVVNLVRQDGTKCSTFLDYSRSQTIARELEKEHGLFRVDGVGSAKGYSPREVEASVSRGRSEPERFTLERSVRAAATASASEDEFVRRLRGDGLLVRPYRNKEEDVRGYSVALVPLGDDRAVYYGGTTIARDLGLGTLRKQWAGGEEEKAAAAKEWQSAERGLRVVAPGREQCDPSFSAGQLSSDLKVWRDRLAALPVDDHEGWRQAAGELSGVFSAWSRATEKEPGPLADVARELSRSAQTKRAEYRPARHDATTGIRTATMLTYLATKDDPRAVLAVFRRLSELTALMRDHQRQAGDLIRQRGLERAARERLVALNDRLHAVNGMTVPSAPTAPARSRGAASVVPEQMIKDEQMGRAGARVEKGMGSR